MRKTRALLTFTLHSTAGISFIGGNAYRLTFGHGWANASMPRVVGKLRENQSGHWDDSREAKRSTSTFARPIPNLGYRLAVQHPLPRPEFLSRQKIVRKIQYSRKVNCPQRKELVLGLNEKTARKPVQGARP